MKLPIQIEPKRPGAKQVEVFDPNQIIEKRASGEITSKEGLELFHMFLKKRFPLERVATLIDELSRATDIKMNSFGAQFKTPNWLARDKGLDKVLKILALSQENVPTGKMAPTKMTFNIITNSPVKVEQKQEPNGSNRSRK